MFAFLSGIGLWHSLDNNNDILNFYKKRIHRVIIPYLLIVIPFCLFLDIYEQKDVLLFLQDVTCISYWIKGRGAWYIAWLIPVYAVYPLYGCIGISLCAILAIVLDHSIKSIKRMLAEVGAVSLESYLFNIYIISVAKVILGNRIDSFEGVCGYVCVAIIGMVLSLLVGKLEK